MKNIFFESGEINDECPECGDTLSFQSPHEDNEFSSGWHCVSCEYVGLWNNPNPSMSMEEFERRNI
jgi:ribosomal protein S27AE